MGKYTIDENKMSQLNDYFINNAVENARKHGFCQAFALFAISLAGYDNMLNTGGYWAWFWLLMAVLAKLQANSFKSKSESGPQL